MITANENISTDFSWDDLLMFIEAGDTIPVIGPDLLVAPDGTTLMQRLAGQLAAELKIDLAKLPEGDRTSLNMIIGESELFRNRRQMVYPRVKAILDRLITSGAFPVPEPLLKLAEIKAFKLFLTITYDPLLATAVNRARPDVQGGAAILTYSPNRFDDLPVDWSEWTRPAVYHLFGRASAAPEYAVTDGDILEFICAMQSQDGRPPRLFQKLQQSNLLLLGVGFPDWLTRFFLRVAKNRRLWETRERIEILAESHQRRSESLVCFCRQFSRETSIYEKDAVDFINELHARWKERDANNTAHEPIVAAAVDMQPGAVFISYASQDRPQAEQLKQALEANGLETWFDRKELQPGNFYEEKIRQNIRQCSLFLPVISNNACARGEGFFRKEWSWAVERLPEFFGTDRPFIMPVVIDNTPPNASQLPEKFKDIHWLPAPGGQAVPEAVERLREALREIRKRERVNA